MSSTMSEERGLNIIEYFRIVGGGIPTEKLTEKEKKHKKRMFRAIRKTFKL